MGDDVSRQLTEAGQSTAVQLVMLQNNCESLRDTIEQMRTELASVPQWHPRPTCPSLWLCWPDKSGSYGKPVILDLTQEDIDSGAPFHTSMVYGPIPEPPAAESRHQTEGNA